MAMNQNGRPQGGMQRPSGNRPMMQGRSMQEDALYRDVLWGTDLCSVQIIHRVSRAYSAD